MLAVMSIKKKKKKSIVAGKYSQVSFPSRLYLLAEDPLEAKRMEKQ